MSNLFNTSRCALPAIPKVDFDFVEDCEVLPPPPPIFNGPDLHLPFAPFPLAACPVISVTSELTLYTPECHGELPGSGQLAVNVTNEGEQPNCETNIHIDLAIPVKCPTFLSTGNIEISYGDVEVAEMEFSIDRTENTPGDCNDANCRYEPNLTIRIPCPTITATGPGVTVTRGAECNYEFAFDPAEACVVLEAEEPVIEETFAAPVPEITFEIVKDPELDCAYRFDLEVLLPKTRLYRGVIQADNYGCDASTNVEIFDEEGGSMGNFNARVWLRGCCDGRPILAGLRCWLMYDYASGWRIVSFEDLVVAPIVMLESFYGGVAPAKFNYFDEPLGSLELHDDFELFKNPKNEAKGWAICSDPDGSGIWRPLMLQEYAEWVVFTLNSELHTTTNTVPGVVVEFHNGAEPDALMLKNTMKWKGKNGAKGIAIRRDDGLYDIIQLTCPMEADE